MPRTATIVTREITPERAGEFVAKGHRLREFFPHSAHFLPRPGPDGARLAAAMCGEGNHTRLHEIVLFAHPSLLDDVAPELFFDPEIVWHQQHFGQRGQVAAVDVVTRGRRMWTMAHQSDLVQRIGRRREWKTKIEKRFGGWHPMLLNALLAFAAERGVARVYTPTADLALEHTDRTRSVGRELFERIYDRDVNRLFAVRRAGRWWSLDVRANRFRLVVPETRRRVIEHSRTLCVCHDVEAGLGHVGVDAELAVLADRTWQETVASLLEIERTAGVRATYNVVGKLLPAVRDDVESAGHCLAFHSYDHRVDDVAQSRGGLGARLRRASSKREAGTDQLFECRRIDYRLKGYRPPRSRITPDLADERLLWHNFEWLASSPRSLQTQAPALTDGIVRIPVALDDHGIYRSSLDFDAWKARLLELVAAQDVTVFSLHDCYAHLWLDRYAALLEEVSALGVWRTLDELAGEVTLAAGT